MGTDQRASLSHLTLPLLLLQALRGSPHPHVQRSPHPSDLVPHPFVKRRFLPSAGWRPSHRVKSVKCQDPGPAGETHLRKRVPHSGAAPFPPPRLGDQGPPSPASQSCLPQVLPPRPWGGESQDFGIRQTWVQILTLPPISCADSEQVTWLLRATEVKECQPRRLQ